MKIRFDSRSRSGVVAVLVLAMCGQTVAQTTEGDASRFDSIAGRYWKILTGRPRRGTAFDQWYRMYLDAGRLDALVAQTEHHLREHAGDPSALILQGLVLEKRQQDPEALAAWRIAEQLSPEDYYPSQLIATLLHRTANSTDAVDALQRAIERKPPRSEVSGMMQQLARLQLTLGRTQDAIATSRRLVSEFPGDPQVMIELARRLQEARLHDEAADTWQQVTELVSNDPFTVLEARNAIAAIRADQGRRDEAIDILDQSLDTVKPDGWAARDLCDRIRNLFDRQKNSDGLVAYWRQRIARQPNDLLPRRQLADALMTAGRTVEATTMLRQTIARAPDRRDVRELLIRSLQSQRQFDAAIDEAQQLVQRYPADIDAWTLLGQLHLAQRDSADTREPRNPDRRPPEHEAAEAFARIADIRPNDAGLAIQAAELCRRAARVSLRSDSKRPPPNRTALDGDNPLVERAEVLYRLAIQRAPDRPDSNVFLGDFLYSIGRTDDAVQAWSRIAGDTDATALLRLAGIFDRHGLTDQAVAAAKSATLAGPDHFDAHATLIRLHLDAGQFDAAYAALPELDRIAASHHERDAALQLKSQTILRAERTTAAIRDLRTRLTDPRLSADEVVLNCRLLGKLYTSIGKPDWAANASRDGLRRAPDDVDLLRDYATQLEAARKPAEAVEQYRRLIELQPDRRDDDYERIVHLHLSRNRQQDARQAAEAFMALEPRTPEGYHRRAEIAFRVNQNDRAIDLLQQAVRMDPRNVASRMKLGQALSRIRDFDAAISHFAECLTLIDDPERSFPAVSGMVDAARQSGRLQAIIDQLLADRTRSGDARTATLRIVEAYRVAQQWPHARRELEAWITEHPADLAALNMMSEIAAILRDWDTVATHREQIAHVTNDPESLRTLAVDYERSGQTTAAADVAVRMVDEFGDDSLLTELITRRLRAGDSDAARQVALSATTAQPTAWKPALQAATVAWVAGDLEDARRLWISAVEQCLASASLSTEFGALPLPTPEVAAIIDNAIHSPASHQSGLAAGTKSSTAPARFQQLDGTDIPTFNELNAARSIYKRLAVLRRLNNMLQPATRPSGESLQAINRLSEAVVVFPDNAFQALVECEIGLELTTESTAHRVHGHGASALSSGISAIGMRAILLARLAAGNSSPDEHLLSAYARRQPDDALPHLIRYFDKWRGNDALMADALAALETSREWFVNHEPHTADTLLCFHAAQLLNLHATEAADRFVLDHLDALPDIRSVLLVSRLPLSVADRRLPSRFIRRIAELAQQPESTSDNLFAALQSLSAAANDTNLSDLLTIFDEFVQRTRIDPGIPFSEFDGDETEPDDNQQRTMDVNDRFPSPNRIITKQRFVILKLLQTFVRADDAMQSMFTSWLRERIARVDGTGRMDFELCLAFSQWWSGHPAAALAQIESLVAGRIDANGNQRPTPTDGTRFDTARFAEARLILSQALHASGDLSRCHAVLCELRHTDHPDPSFARRTRTRIEQLRNELLVSQNKNMLCSCLVAELESDVAPQLDLYFDSPSTWLPDGSDSTADPRRALLLDILDFAITSISDKDDPAVDPQDGWMSRIERTSAAAAKRFPASQRLAALAATVHLKRQAFVSARQSLEQWRTVIGNAQPDAAAARLLALSCLDHRATLADANRIAIDCLVDTPTSDTNDADAAFVRQFTDRLIEHESRDSGAAFIAELFSETELRSVAEIVHIVELLPAMNSQLIPSAIQSLAKTVRRRKDELSGLDLLAEPLHRAVQGAMAAWSIDQAHESFDGLLQLLFPRGPEQDAELWTWTIRAAAAAELPEVGSLGGTAIAIAAQTDRLAEQLESWNTHRFADSDNMLALRAEAAFAAGQPAPEIDALLARLLDRYDAGGVAPRVWSNRFLNLVNADRIAADFVLEHRGRLWTDPGGRIYLLDQIPAERFHVTAVELTGDGVRDPQLRRLLQQPANDDDSLMLLGRLRKLESLSLSHSAPSNAGLKHLAGLSHLKRLVLDDTPVTDAGLQHLVALRKLSSLSLRGTSVTSQGVAELNNVLPDCRIER